MIYNVVYSLNNVNEKENEKEHANDCQRNKKSITSNKWSKCFPSNFKEIQYGKTNYFTFIFIIYIIERKTSKKHSINDIKKTLYQEYSKYLADFRNQIIDILNILKFS